MSTRWLVALGMVCLLGCADPFIEATTELADTPDTVGPYQVWTTVVGARGGDSIELRYRIDDGDERVAAMRRTDDDGDGPGELYRGAIGGQAAGSTIRYYVVVESGGDEVAVDPGAGAAAPFVFSVTP